MRSHLSAHAASVLEDLNIQRDPEWMTDTETLRATLGERGLVAHDSALEIEEMAGGAELWPGKHLGIFASLRETHGQDQPQRRLSKAIVRTEKKRAEAAAANPAVQRDAPRHAPLMLVHIRPWNDLSMPTVIVNQRGTLLFEDPDDDLDVREPAFDSFVQFIETFALLQEAMYLEPRTEPTRRHWLWTDERIGDELARALDLEPFPPATGTFGSAWTNGSLHVVEQRISHFSMGTKVGTPDIDEATRVLAEILPRSMHIDWWSPVPRAVEALSFPVPRWEQRPGEPYACYRWGNPRGYRPFDPMKVPYA